MLNPKEREWLGGVITVYLQCRKFDKAEPLLHLLTALYPADVRPLKQLAYLYYQNREFAQSLDYCDRCDEIGQQQDARIYLLKSFCHLKLGNQPLARQNYDRYKNLRNTL